MSINYTDVIYVEKYKDYPESELSGRIIQLAIEVHKKLGPGFLEKIYENALITEFNKNGIKYECQKNYEIYYNNIKIGEHRIDLIVEDKILVELKSLSNFDNIHRAQIISYLTATKIKVGLLVNFGKTKIDVERIIK